MAIFIYCFYFNYIYLYYFFDLQNKYIKILLSILFNSAGLYIIFCIFLLESHYLSEINVKFISIYSCDNNVLNEHVLIDIFLLKSLKYNKLVQLFIRVLFLFLFDFLILLLLFMIVSLYKWWLLHCLIYKKYPLWKRLYLFIDLLLYTIYMYILRCFVK